MLQPIAILDKTPKKKKSYLAKDQSHRHGIHIRFGSGYPPPILQGMWCAMRTLWTVRLFIGGLNAMRIRCASDSNSDSCERWNRIGCAFDAHCGVHVNGPLHPLWLWRCRISSNRCYRMGCYGGMAYAIHHDTTWSNYYMYRAVATVWTVVRSRYSREKFWVMNINELIIVNTSVIDRARQVALFRQS